MSNAPESGPIAAGPSRTVIAVLPFLAACAAVAVTFAVTQNRLPTNWPRTSTARGRTDSPRKGPFWP
jgi:hypothetical protein